MDHYMGIDIGTSGCKAVVFDETGNQVSHAYREYDIITKEPGWAELNTDEVVEKCFDVIREAATGLRGQIIGLGISSQGEAFTLIDENGKAICNAMVSSDTRAKEYAGTWAKEFGEDKLYRITGHTPHPMFSLFKLLWLRDNRRETWSAARKILCFEDLLQYRLGIAEPSISWPLAGRTMLFDVVNHGWNDEILATAGIKREQLSNPIKSGCIAGFVRKDIARELNLGEETYIVAAGHDQVCSGLGAGAIQPGIAVYSLGTVECLTAAFDKPVFSDELKSNNLCTYDHAAPGMYATIAYSLTGGNLLKWFRNEFGKVEVEKAKEAGGDAYDLLLGQMPENPSRLLVLPYFTNSGTPYFDVDVRGAIFGLDFSATRGEILKALLEGLAFEIRLNLEILGQSGYEIKELRAIGGGTKSLRNLQLRSDVMDTPITVTGVTEAGCSGAAILARAAHKNMDVKDIVSGWIHPVSKVEPVHNCIYENKFNSYKKLYPGIKELLYGKV
jgi:xylulokinase